MSLGDRAALSHDAARIVAELFAVAQRARNRTQSRTITTLMLKGGRPAQWLQDNLLRDLERIGLVTVDPRGACTLTAVGVEVARWFKQEAQIAFPMTHSTLLEAAMARLMNSIELAPPPVDPRNPSS